MDIRILLWYSLSVLVSVSNDNVNNIMRTDMVRVRARARALSLYLCIMYCFTFAHLPTTLFQAALLTAPSNLWLLYFGMCSVMVMGGMQVSVRWSWGEVLSVSVTCCCCRPTCLRHREDLTDCGLDIQLSLCLWLSNLQLWSLVKSCCLALTCIHDSDSDSCWRRYQYLSVAKEWFLRC